jgi:EAL domain-containing protein (putative c-di-GMP-specific phosphodiesterase class I)/GGDEF domain-containing protein
MLECGVNLTLRVMSHVWGMKPRRMCPNGQASLQQIRSALLDMSAGRLNASPIAGDDEVTRALSTIAETIRAAERQRLSRDVGLWGLIGFDGEQDIYVALLRIDRFEALSRRVGHETADAMVRAVQTLIAQTIPVSQIGRATRGRIEFAFSAVSPDAARRAVTALHGRLEQPLICGNEAFDLQTAIGMAAAGDGAEISEIIERAERALALADTSPVRCMMWDEPLQAEAAARLALTRDLRAALAAGDLSVVYQPKLHLHRGVVDSAEGLVRWNHPVRGFIPPDLFVAIAEESGDIDALTRFVLTRAIADQAMLAGRGHALSINVNLSGGLVADQDFCAWVQETCRGAVGRIGLEITETAVITDPELALYNLKALAEGGASIAIDDYGSGLSSLVYLKQLPADELKIDKQFILGLTSSNRDPLIVRSTIDLAHALEMEVTAEGVDNPHALALLKIMGCDRAQGFHIAPPLDLPALEDFLLNIAGRDLTAKPSQLLRIKKA